MEVITPDYWKGIVRGVICMLLATMTFTAQTSIVKWGSIIGYTAAVILIFRGIIQFIFCIIEATMFIKAETYNGPKKLQCKISRIYNDIKSIGILPKRTIIPIFNETASLSKSNINATLSDYGSFQSTKSYSYLYPPPSESNQNQEYHHTQITPQNSYINLNINNCESPQIHININNPSQPNNAISSIKIIKNTQQSQTSVTSDIQKRWNIHKVKRRQSTKSYKCLIWSAIIMRGVCGGVGTLLLFQASMLLPVGDMQSLMALTAAITPFLAFLFFKDTLTKLHLLSLIGAVIGVVLIVQPPFMFRKVSEDESKSEKEGEIVMGYVYAISGAAVQSLIYICIQFARKVPIYMLTMSQSIMGVVTGLIVLLYSGNLGNSKILWIDNGFDAAFLIITGCVGYTFLWLITMSGRYITSGVIALLLNLSIVWGYIIQITVFEEKPTWITIIGAVCMFLSAAIVSMDKISDAKRKSMSVIQRNIATTVGV